MTVILIDSNHSGVSSLHLKKRVLDSDILTPYENQSTRQLILIVAQPSCIMSSYIEEY